MNTAAYGKLFGFKAAVSKRLNYCFWVILAQG